MPESRKEPKSKYTADRNIPGAFEGETVTRRRFMTLTTHAAGGIATAAVLLPVLGFAAGSAIFERAPVIWTPIGKPEDFPDDDYLPRVVTLTQGIGEVGKATVYVRRFNPEFDESLAQELAEHEPDTVWICKQAMWPQLRARISALGYRANALGTPYERRVIFEVEFAPRLARPRAAPH